MSDLSDLNRYQRALEAAERRGSSVRLSSQRLLSFESSIETDYQAHRLTESLPLVRLALALAVAFFLVFFAVDAMLASRYQHWWTIVPILLVSSVVNLAVFTCTWVERLKTYMAWLAASAALINVFAFSFSSAYGYKMGLTIPPEAPVIQQVYTLFLLNLSFRFAAPVAAITVGIFVLLHSMAGMDQSEYFYRCFMMAAAAIVGTLACYITERTQRLAWLRSRLLRELSEHDSLTGLYNHRVFYQRGEQLLRQSRRDAAGVAVLVGDVDHFKKFNDSHGHLAGDNALRLVAAALSQSARRPLDLAARLGGEEFGLLLYNVTQAKALQRAEEMRHAIRGLMLADGRHVTISIGVAFAESQTETTIEALIGAADTALYQAKHAGRDRVAG